MLLPMEAAPAWVDRPDNEPIECLLVDDNLVVQLVARGLLQLLGAQVATAKTGTEAISYATWQRFDLIFMDIMMPDGDGVAATVQIRTLPESVNRDTPIIAFTSLGDANRVEWLQQGMNDVLPKPFTRADLFRVFNRWLRRRV